MKVKKPLLVAGAISLGLAGLATFSTASAQTSTGSNSLIDKLVSKFNLNKEEVQAVFDEMQAEREAERQTEFSERLQEQVEDGDITADQKTLIENKMKEVHAAMQAEREELEAWAEEQDIDAKYLMMGGPRGDDDRLQDAVDDGDLTAEQKTAIEAKQEELQDTRDAARDSLEQWADDNGIDTDLLRGVGGGRGGHGGPGRM